MNALSCITILLQLFAVFILSLLGEALPAVGSGETVNWLPTTIIGAFIVLQIASTFLLVTLRSKRGLWFGIVLQFITVAPLVYLHIRFLMDGEVWIFLPCFATVVFLLLGMRSRFTALSPASNHQAGHPANGRPGHVAS